MLYANDTQVYGQFIPAEIYKGIASMQNNAYAVFDWATGKRVELNVRKTKAMVFCIDRNLAMPIDELPQIKIYVLCGAVILGGGDV